MEQAPWIGRPHFVSPFSSASSCRGWKHEEARRNSSERKAALFVILRGCENIQSGPRWWSLRCEIKERGGGDAVASLTTREAEIAAQPPQPEGLLAVCR